MNDGKTIVWTQSITHTAERKENEKLQVKKQQYMWKWMCLGVRLHGMWKLNREIPSGVSATV